MGGSSKVIIRDGGGVNDTEARVQGMRLWVNAALSTSGSAFFNPLTASGSTSIPAVVASLNVQGYGAVSIQLSGTWTGTVFFEASVNGTDFFLMQSRIVTGAGPAVIATGIGANCIAIMPYHAVQIVRARATVVSSGTIVADIRAIPGGQDEPGVNILSSATGTPIGDSLVTPISVNLATPGSPPFTLDLPTGTVPAGTQRGLIPLVERDDVLGTLATANGTLVRPRTNNRGALWVVEDKLRDHFTGSTNGRPIAIAAVATPGTLIHTATAAATLIDRVWVYVTNRSTSEQTLTLEWGAAGAVNEIKIPVPCNDTVLAVPGWAIGGAVSQVISGFASAASVLSVAGYIQREQST